MAVQFTSTTKFLVASLVQGQRLPTNHTITVLAAANANDTVLDVAALTGYLQAGREITIGTTEVIVAEDAPRGSTELTIMPLTESIAINAIGTYYELFEFIGGESLDLAGQDQVITIRNFKSGQWSESAKTMTGLTIDCEGQFHTEDKALTAVLRPAYFVLGQEIYAEITRGNGDRWTGAFLVSNYGEPSALDNVVRVRFSLSGQGAIGIPAPPVLTAV